MLRVLNPVKNLNSHLSYLLSNSYLCRPMALSKNYIPQEVENPVSYTHLTLPTN